MLRLGAEVLGGEGIAEYLVAELTASSVPPGKLVFEIPESVASDALSNAVELMRNLGAYGCRFAVCDFGRTEASFSWVKGLPVSYLCVDQAIVQGAGEDPRALALVHSIAEIGRVLEMRTVAGRVDDDATLERLRGADVDLVAGQAIAAATPLEGA